jgi:mono/diheme cytochrome c family protein
MRLCLWIVLLALANPSLAAPDRSRQNYIQFCAGCHQLDGSGSPGVGIPDMRAQLGYFLNSPGGRAFLVQVPGSANSPLSNAELALLLNWMLKVFSPAQMPASFVPYSENEVSQLRAQVPAAVDELRRQVTADLQRQGFPVK